MATRSSWRRPHAHHCLWRQRLNSRVGRVWSSWRWSCNDVSRATRQPTMPTIAYKSNTNSRTWADSEHFPPTGQPDGQLRIRLLQKLLLLPQFAVSNPATIQQGGETSVCLQTASSLNGRSLSVASSGAEPVAACYVILAPSLPGVSLEASFVAARWLQIGLGAENGPGRRAGAYPAYIYINCVVAALASSRPGWAQDAVCVGWLARKNSPIQR